MSNERGMRIYGYGRVSVMGKRQATSERFHSTAMQFESVDAWARYHGAQIVEWVEDLNRSGGDMIRRPELRRIITSVEKREADGLVVCNVDRFSRNTVDGLAAVTNILDAGGRFVAAQEGVDSATMPRHAFEFLVTGMFAQAAFYRGMKSDGMKALKQRLIGRGLHTTNWTPTGYIRGRDIAGYVGNDARLADAFPDVVEPLRLYAHPVFGPVITAAYELRASGASLRECADLLAENRVRTNRSPDLPGEPTWATGSLRTLLSRRCYLGEAHWGEYVEPNAHDALTDLATWIAANTASGGETQPRRRAVKPPPEEDRYLLRGLVRCAGCSHPLKPDTERDGGERVPMYRCRKRHQNGICKAPAAARAHVLEAEVERIVLAHLGSERAYGRAPETEISRAALELERAEQELATYLRVTQLAHLDEATAVEQIGERKRRVDDAKRALDAARGPKVIGLPSSISLNDAWPTLSIEHRRRILSATIDFALVRRGRVISDRVGIVWSGQALDGLSRPGFSAPVEQYPFDWAARRPVTGSQTCQQADNDAA